MDWTGSRAFVATLLSVLLCYGCGHGQLDVVDPTELPDGEPGAHDEASKERASELIEQERFAGAIELLVKIRPSDDPEIEELWVLAQNEERAKAALVKACLDTDSRDIEIVYDQCWLIPETSRYAERGCCTTAGTRYGEATLTKATDLLRRGKTSEALALAEMLAADTKLTEGIRSKAERTVAKAERRSRRREPGRDQAAAERAYEMAKAHIAGEDHESCIQVLTEAPQSEKVVRVLISCYFGSGKLRSACILAKQHEDLSSARAFIEMRCP